MAFRRILLLRKGYEVKTWIALVFASLIFFQPATSAQSPSGKQSAVRVAVVKMPYVGERNIPELSGGPDYLQQGGIQKLLEEHGFQAKQVSAVSLTPEEDKAY